MSLSQLRCRVNVISYTHVLSRSSVYPAIAASKRMFNLPPMQIAILLNPIIGLRCATSPLRLARHQTSRIFYTLRWQNSTHVTNKTHGVAQKKRKKRMLKSEQNKKAKKKDTKYINSRTSRIFWLAEDFAFKNFTFSILIASLSLQSAVAVWLMMGPLFDSTQIELYIFENKKTILKSNVCKETLFWLVF